MRTNLAAIRKARGLGATDLARKAGVSRQTIHAIEAGAYTPNTEVALRLARELEVGVEALFSLAEPAGAEAGTVSAAYLGRGTPGRGQAVRTARVGAQWVSVPVDARPWLLPEADAVVAVPPVRDGRARLRLPVEGDARRDRIVLAGCDPAAGLFARMVENLSGVEIVHAPASSRLALDWLKAEQVHVAGSHLEEPDGSEFNLPFIRRHFPDRDMAVVTFARWEEGLAVAPGNPKGIRAIADLGRGDVALMNREPGSGSRTLLDRGLRAAGLKAKAVRGYRRIAFGHLAAAHAVLTGAADCCIAIRSAAQAFGLDFVPLRSGRYDLVLHRESLRLAAVETLLDALQRAALRRKLEMFAGYDTTETGVVRA